MSSPENNVQIVAPPLGESVTEATVTRWYKRANDPVNIDELLVELETDKVTLEVNAPASGVLSEIKADVGVNVEVGAILGYVAAGEKAASPQPSANKEGPVQAASPSALAVQAAPSALKESEAQSTRMQGVGSPAATKIAADSGLVLTKIQGSGKDSRITKGDVLKALDMPHERQNSQVAALVSQLSREERVKMTRLRKTIAQRLKDSQNTAAILTTFNEIDMSEVIKLRQVYQDKFKEKHGVKLGFMSFFVKAVVHALKVIPAVNAEIDGDEIVYKNYYDIGVAVGTDQGLVVPIVRNADELSLAGIELAILNLSKRARDAKLSMAEMTGGTFSITNGGIYGSLLSTPIINPPQSAILGMHNIIERPVAVGGNVVVRPMIYVALSYDHRIIDGKEAVTFLVRIKELIEKPEKLLLDI